MRKVLREMETEGASLCGSSCETVNNIQCVRGAEKVRNGCKIRIRWMDIPNEIQR